MIDPSIWQSEKFARLSTFQRLMWIGLFSNADDQGRMRGHAVLLRSRLFPYDDVAIGEIEAGIEALEAIGWVARYEVDGTGYLQVVKWWDWQKPAFAWPSKMPAPEGWEDREHYRRGNEQVYRNWPGREDSGAEVERERGESGASVEEGVAPGPRGRDSGGGSGGGGEGEARDSSSEDVGPGMEAVRKLRLLGLGAEPAARVVGKYGGRAVLNMAALVERQGDAVKNPGHLIVHKLGAGASAPEVGRRRYAEHEGVRS